MSVRGLAVAGAVCLALSGITSCGNDNGAKNDRTGKGTDSPSTRSVGSKPDKPAQAPNGIARLTPQEILNKAAKTLETSPSWRVESGNGTEGIALAVDDKGNCQGAQSGEAGDMEFMQQGDIVYAKPKAGFWESHFQDKASQAEQFVGDRYVKTTSGDGEFAPFFCVRNMFRASVFSEEAIAAAQLTKGAETDVNGTRALQLKGTLDGGPATVYVATTGDPHPLVVEAVEEGTSMRMTFTDFGKPLVIDTPAPEDTVEAREVRKAIGISD